MKRTMGRWRRLSLELGPPVTERFERNALSLAILSLIQVATTQRFVMRPPERLAMRATSTPMSPWLGIAAPAARRMLLSGVLATPRGSVLPGRVFAIADEWNGSGRQSLVTLP
jgi:hypothetical protein